MKQKATLVLPVCNVELKDGIVILAKGEVCAYSQKDKPAIFETVKPYLVNDEPITDGYYFFYEGKVYICGRVDKDFVYAMGQRDKKGFDKNKCYKVIAMPSEINLTVDEIASIVKSGGACFVEVEKQENPMQKPVANENGNSSLWERMYDRYEEGVGYELVKENGKVKITLT